MLSEYIANDADHPWTEARSPKTGKLMATFKHLLEEGAEGPEAGHSTRDNGHVAPHLHQAAQFQVVTRGSVKYPTFEMTAVSVHYTDHCVPYGPFDTSPDYHHFVLHAMRGPQVFTSEAAARKNINRVGREITARADSKEWEPSPTLSNVRRKLLISEPTGVGAELLNCPPGTRFQQSPSKYGRYEIVLRGSVAAAGNIIKADGLRFVRGDGAPSPFICGAEGAEIIVLEFDKDAAQSYVFQAVGSVAQ